MKLADETQTDSGVCRCGAPLTGDEPSLGRQWDGCTEWSCDLANCRVCGTTFARDEVTLERLVWRHISTHRDEPLVDPAAPLGGWGHPLAERVIAYALRMAEVDHDEYPEHRFPRLLLRGVPSCAVCGAAADADGCDHCGALFIQGAAVAAE